MAEDTAPGLLIQAKELIRPTDGMCRLMKGATKKLSPSDLADLETILEDTQFPAHLIANLVNERGVICSPSLIRQHRRGECACG